MNVALYSAIYGEYDSVKPIPPGFDVPAYMFTDSEETSKWAKLNGWIPRVQAMPQPTPMLQHKWWKIHPHEAVPDAEVTLWIDGSITITVDDYVSRCLAALGDDDWCAVTHPWRNCIFEEGYYSAQMPRYERVPIIEQLDFYAASGHPQHWGLIAAGANVRRHTDSVREANDRWWHENITRTHQDQLSLPFVLRSMGDDLRWNTNMPWSEWWRVSPHGVS